MSTEPSQASLVVLTADWVRGRIVCDSPERAQRLQAKLDVIKAVLGNVRDLDMIYHQLSPEEATSLLNKLSLTPEQIVTYIPFKDFRLSFEKRPLTESEQTVLGRVKEIYRYSYSVADMGLIRGLKIEGHELEVTYTVTTEECPHKGPIQEGIRLAVVDLMTIVGVDLGLRSAQVRKVADVWQASDMSGPLKAAAERARGAIASAHAGNRRTALTVAGKPV